MQPDRKPLQLIWSSISRLSGQEEGGSAFGLLQGAFFISPDLPALTALAPEQPFYVGGLSKTLNPGLRLGRGTPSRNCLERVLGTLAGLAAGEEESGGV